MEIGEYKINVTFGNQVSNTITFNITVDSYLSIDNDTLCYSSVKVYNLTVKVTDITNSVGLMYYYIKEGNNYDLKWQKESKYNKSSIINSTYVYQRLKAQYKSLNSSYQFKIRCESNNHFVNPSNEVEFTFTILILKDSEIIVKTLSLIESYVQFNITVVDRNNNSFIVEDADIRLSVKGFDDDKIYINITITNGIYTDKTLKEGTYYLNLYFVGNDELIGCIKSFI